MAITGPMVLGPVLGIPLEGGDTFSKHGEEKEKTCLGVLNQKLKNTEHMHFSVSIYHKQTHQIRQDSQSNYHTVVS